MLKGSGGTKEGGIGSARRGPAGEVMVRLLPTGDGGPEKEFCKGVEGSPIGTGGNWERRARPSADMILP